MTGSSLLPFLSVFPLTSCTEASALLRFEKSAPSSTLLLPLLPFTRFLRKMPAASTDSLPALCSSLRKACSADKELKRVAQELEELLEGLKEEVRSLPHQLEAT